MGVLSEIRTEETGDDSSAENNDARRLLLSDAVGEGPFAQSYETERFNTDSEAVQEMLTGVIALANIL